ncbi:MAG TPA: hypothetical protein VHO67_19895 [Polyangia bacterium]|nr:hypothetical protein [Polyangia bacterium]
MKRDFLNGSAALLLLAGVVAGCGHAGPRIGAAVPAEPSRDALLDGAAGAIRNGRYQSAGIALTAVADRERGRRDPELDFWSELLALARCEPLLRVPRVTAADPPLVDEWDRLRRLVEIERLRLARNPAQIAKKPGPLADQRASTAATSQRRDDQIRWPLEAERWPDETIVPVLVDRCAPGESLALGRPDQASDGEVALVSATANALPAGHPAAPTLWLQAAVLDVTHGRAARANAMLARLEAVGGAQNPDLDAQERQSLVLAAALAAVGDPAAPPERVLATGRAALRLDVPAATVRALSLVIADRLVAAQRADDAVAILGSPPHGDDALGRAIAFRQAQAHAHANRRAQLLAEAREALHGHSRADVQDDPALAAIMDLALRTLRASPVSPETMEVLEALGPPRERLARAEAFAAGALDGGAPLSAMATFEWLYQNDTDPSRQLQHLARECVAAARAGARADFARTFHLLAGQETEGDTAAARPRAGKAAAGKPEDKHALIASSEADARRERRRSARSADWQRALLVVARDALTALVDADDQADLATLVATLKRHLDEAGRGPVDDELTTLYRAASAHLKTGARAYAETVGAERRPILLGDIRVDRTYDVEPPHVDLTGMLQEVGTLLFVPRGRDPAVVARWPGRPTQLLAGGTP